MPTITHFDIPVENLERAKKFYADLFSWKIERASGPIEYYLVETKTLKGKRGLGGGMTKRENLNRNK